MKLTNTTILFFILLVAIALRFFNYFEIPYTHDELSALFRTNYDNFSTLIEKGVKEDGHPAGIQVFLYYWAKLFCTTEWIVKLPFTIFGIISVFLIYLIAKRWFNETVGLISSAFLASIQFTVIYSQIARPYISGLFFSLLMVFYWTKIIQNPDKQFYKNSALFIVSASLCAYNHYFSLLFAAIVGISGLFFIKKHYLIRYLIACLLILILYAPHFNIFIYQLKIGGVEGWLGKPHNDFFLRYIEYIFNFSIISIILAIILFVFGAIKMSLKDINYKNYILFSIWFIIPFLIGFYYSKYFNAVLQFSVLIFNFPFLFFILYGHIKPQKSITNLILISYILAINTFSLIYDRKHYELFYNSPFRGIVTDYQQVKQKNNDIVSIIDSDKKITKYYLSKLKIDSNFIWFDSFNNEYDFKKFIENESKSHSKLYLGCLSFNNPLTVPIIQDYYPKIEWQKNYAGGTTYMFTKEIENGNDIIDFLNFESDNQKSWNSIDTENYNDSISFSEKKSYLIDNKTEWGPTYSAELEKIITNKNNFIDISLKAKSFNGFNDVILVSSLESNGENIFWGGTSFDKFALSDSTKDKWSTIHHSMKLSDIYINYRNILLKIYIWNKGKNTFFIDDFIIKLRQGNPVIYGLNEKF
ncbi:MAG: glycosyltransferase family 39 protein [Bacteroidia bacterium]|nr:glycosyltransferase family 39 protein [Bacteroidia bacterium]